MHKALKVKSKGRWILQKVGEDRYMDQLRKGTRNEQRRTNKKAKKAAATGNATGVGQPRPSGAHILPQMVLSASHVTVGFNVSPIGCFSIVFILLHSEIVSRLKMKSTCIFLILSLLKNVAEVLSKILS